MSIYHNHDFDIVIIGAGHAGCEAAFAASRLGFKTLLTTMSMESIADLPCNPNIGGTGKGHLVREIDALGGEMALVIDQSYIQSKMLNISKGPAVHSLRVQADKRKYHEVMKSRLEETENIYLREAEAVDILIEKGKAKSVLMRSGMMVHAKAIIIATGTFLRGKILMGELAYDSGPNGMMNSQFLSEKLEKKGIKWRRFKTGSPARVHRDSIDYSKMEIQAGDEEFIPFSFLNYDNPPKKEQMDCYLTYTSLETKKIIEDNIEKSPMYSEEFDVGTGPRYCPSIEDKIVRFPNRDLHQIFLEPEGENTAEIYVQGASTSLPEEVQKNLYQSIDGLEKVEIMRSAYAIEYDCIDPTILSPTLEHMEIENLYFAGQINGTSGYEEAAAQGLMAGTNAALKINGKDPFILDRSDGYIGVLIDDLVTKGTDEPYRMLTARAEYRLSLRQDNADFRLTEKGYHIGIVDDNRYNKMLSRKKALEKEIKRLKEVTIHPNKENNNILEELGSSPLSNATTLGQLLRRPEINYENSRDLDPDRKEIPVYLSRQVEVEIKYKGYIEKQSTQIRQFKKLEERSLAAIEDYSDVKGLRGEAMERLKQIRPLTLGQASRISGVSPSDINVLLIYLESLKRRRKEAKS